MTINIEFIIAETLLSLVTTTNEHWPDKTHERFMGKLAI
jgi:hypothetical protein